MSDEMTQNQATLIGEGISLRTPNTLPDAVKSPAWNADGTFNGWVAAVSPSGSGTEVQVKSGAGFGHVAGSAYDGTTLTVQTLIVETSLILNSSVLPINAATITIDDPLIRLADNNPADSVDIGWYGAYTSSGTKFRGGFFDATDGKFKLFSGSEEEPTTTVNTAGAGYTLATLVVGAIEATAYTGLPNLPAGSGTELQYRSSATAFGAITSSWDGLGLAIGANLSADSLLVGVDLGISASGYLHVASNSTSTSIFQRASADNGAANIQFWKSRGTVAVPLVITSSDDLGDITAYGYDGREWISAGQIRFVHNGTVGEEQGRIGGKLVFATGTDAAPTVLTDRMTIDSAGLVTVLGGVLDLTATGMMRFGTDFGWGMTSNIVTFTKGTQWPSGYYLHVSPGVRGITIEAAGLVGINKTSLISSQLDIISSGSTIPGITVTGATSHSVALASLVQGGGSPTGNFISCTSSGGTEGDYFKITSGGFLGLGTPTAAVTVRALAGNVWCFNHDVTQPTNGGWYLNTVGQSPGYAFKNDSTTGMGTPSSGSNIITWYNAGVETMRLSAATLQMGVNAGTATHQTFKSHDAVGTNIVAANFYAAPGRSTGNAAPASYVIQGTVAGAGGSTVQTLVDVVTVKNGMVGIGHTMVPEQVLDAVGVIRSRAATLNPNFEFYSTTNAAVEYQLYLANEDLRFYAQGVGDTVTFAKTGLVGINKSSSIGAQLHVVQSTTTTIGGLFEGATSHSVPSLKVIEGGGSPTGNVFQVTANNGTTNYLSVAAGGNATTVGTTQFYAVGNVNAGASLGITGKSYIYSPSDGLFLLQNNAGTDFSRLQFGLTTAAAPSIKRSGATLAFRLADDSADCPITASNITASGFIDATSIRCDGSVVLDLDGFRMDIGNSGGMTSATLCNGNSGSVIIHVGGNTLSYGAIKGTNTGILSFRLADDSAGCSIISGMTNTTTVGHTITGITSHSVPLLALNMGATPTGNVVEINSSGGSGGDIARVTVGGAVVAKEFLPIAANTYTLGSTSFDFTHAHVRNVRSPGNLFVSANAGGSIAFDIPTGTRVVTISSSLITFAQGTNIQYDSSTGTIHGTTASQKQSWWGAASVVQQILATGAGATVDNVISMLQTLGLCRQA